MKHSKIFLYIILFLVVLSFLQLYTTLYAVWWYNNAIQEQDCAINISFFSWEGEEILPDDDSSATSQLDCVTIIIDALNNKNLPEGQNSKLNQYIKKRIKNFNKLEYGSVDTKEDIVSLLSDIATVNPNFEFILTGEVVNKEVVSYQLYMIDITYYNATMDKWDNANITTSQYINNPSLFQEYFYPVSKVTINKNSYGQWASTMAQIGYTGFGYYAGSNNGGGQKVWTFDPDSWVEGEPNFT